MPDLANIAAVIFDLDGLVLDSEPLFFSAWYQAFQTMGYLNIPADFFESLSGLATEDLLTKITAIGGSHFDLDTFQCLSKQFWLHAVEEQGIVLKPGFLALLAYLNQRKLPFALATNSPLQPALFSLARAGIPSVFEHIIAREQVKLGKPAPDLFIAAAKLLQEPIHKCLVLEDSPSGVLAAHHAGAMVIYVPSTLAKLPAVVANTREAKNLFEVLEWLNPLNAAMAQPTNSY